MFSKKKTRGSTIQEHRDKFISMPKEEKREFYKCGKKFMTLDDIPTWAEYHNKMDEKRCSVKNTSGPAANSDLNTRVSIWQGDVTRLEIDSIGNAANNSLLGGGGVDGAIHNAAGSALRAECETLNGCDTGDAKISAGYKLPAKYVIHTVGPIGQKEEQLRSAYTRSLAVMKENKLNAIAFPCISTGIYGYPNDPAAHMALTVVRDFLETDDNAKQVERIIFCLFLNKDVKIYEDLMQYYFPVGEEKSGATSTTEDASEAAAPKNAAPSEDAAEKAQEKTEEDSTPTDAATAETSTDPKESKGDDTEVAGESSEGKGADAEHIVTQPETGPEKS